MMKNKLFYLLFALVMPFVAFPQEEAGDIASIWSYPVVYNYDEQVSWYFDLTGTTFAENEDIYIWIWSPSEPDAGNWENSSDFAKLTYVGDLVWRFDLTPTVYFNQTIDEIKASAGFWLRLKDKTGAKQSGVSSVPLTDFSGFATSNEAFKFYPTKFYLDQPLSILFNSNLVEGFEGATSVHMHAGLNDWDEQASQQYQAWLPEIVEKTKLADMGNGIYRMDLIPGEYFNVPDGYVMTNMVFLFVKDDWAATTPDYVMKAPDAPVRPDPVLLFFPQKISQKDILVIIRQYNETYVSELTYTITAGTKTISGDFQGTVDDMKAYIDLCTELKGMTGISKINVKVTDNRDRTITDTDISLVTPD
jgi:hypothetical protein